MSKKGAFMAIRTTDTIYTIRFPRVTFLKKDIIGILDCSNNGMKGLIPQEGSSKRLYFSILLDI